jgi:hypothetical protein
LAVGGPPFHPIETNACLLRVPHSSFFEVRGLTCSVEVVIPSEAAFRPTRDLLFALFSGKFWFVIHLMNDSLATYSSWEEAQGRKPMKLWIGRIGIAMMLVFAGWFIGHHPVAVVHAQTPPIIPSAFGHCAGFINHGNVDGLIFEANDGTIRVVNVANGAVMTFARQ